VAVVVQSNTLSTRGIVDEQSWAGIGSIFTDWYLVPAFIAFGIFGIAATAEINHPPFDLVEAEQELVGGFHTEYTGIRFAIFFLAEFMNLVTMCAIAVTLFLGGPAGPGIGFLAENGWFNAWVMPLFWFLAKLLVLLFVTVWVRTTVPRLRYDQLMDFGWKFLIEIAFIWVMVSAVIVVARDEGWNLVIVVPVAAVGALLLYGILYLCMPKHRSSDEAVFDPDKTGVR
jgi:NADH-quinone oxidoreductase subunit H